MQPSKSHNNSILEQNIIRWINHGLNLTVDLVRLDSDGQPEGFCSGFLIQRNGKLYVLSAGHGLGRGQWFLQTHISDSNSNQTVSIPMNGVSTLGRGSLPIDPVVKAKPIDFAWCEISFAEVAVEMKKKPYLIEAKEFQWYTGPLDKEPQPNVPYTYAAHNQLLHLKAYRSFLEQGATYETFMEYDGIESSTGWYRFKLARPHQGHDYYHGASGGPIFAPEGTIVSMVLHGSTDGDVLYGLPLCRYAGCVGLE